MLTLDALVRMTLTAATDAVSRLVEEGPEKASITEVMTGLAGGVDSAFSETYLAQVLKLEDGLLETTPQAVHRLFSLMKGLATYINQNIAVWDDLAHINYDDNAVMTLSLHERWMPNPVFFEVNNIQSFYVNIDNALFAAVFSDQGELSQLDPANSLWLAHELFGLLHINTVESLLVAPLHIGGNEKYKDLVCLKAAGSGIQSHISHKSSYRPAIMLFDTWIDYSNDYSQFADLVNLVSESNSYVFSPDKFLRKYQVLEEVMFRQGLIKVMRRVGRPTISLRQWKTVSEGMADGERTTFIKLVDAIFTSSNRLGCSAWDEIKQKWSALVISVGGRADTLTVTAQIDELLFAVWDEKYKLCPDLFNNDQKGKLLGGMIYSFRCSVVHNKATEFFLSSQTYNDGVAVFFDEFLLPIVDYLMLFSITHPKSGSRYPEQTIRLW